jgi:hypothetical protein
MSGTDAQAEHSQKELVRILSIRIASAISLVTLGFGLIVWPCAEDVFFEGVPYQLSTVI